MGLLPYFSKICSANDFLFSVATGSCGLCLSTVSISVDFFSIGSRLSSFDISATGIFVVGSVSFEIGVGLISLSGILTEILSFSMVSR